VAELHNAVGFEETTEIAYRLGRVLAAQENHEEALEWLSRAAADAKTETGAEAKKTLEELGEQLGGQRWQEELAAARNARRERKRRELLQNFTAEPSKDFTLAALDGAANRLSALQGKVVFLNFWTTWCGPCLREMPFLVNLQEKHHEQGLVIMGVNTNWESKGVAQVVEKHKLNFPILLDQELTVQRLYEVEGYPTNILIDRQGQVRFRKSGFAKSIEEDLEIVIEELLEERP
jgi:thiol-disulfide isomerase/thioredoxin